ncbi:D-alanyl-D-alanine carboxypeptidase family protein [Parasphingorhabdus cellanae]|uniref:serine-type D-Ala-D-Ala carboxypeptidase n=1 Tax=Parasphingorhabdus cellanae TaxID=2806553 RepID=A0ABX7T3S4_9SPHN|nr:D-alanyl-D-alanine carboxypeptidase family protein [Parasphingorhabdus cellanae]QTD56230.1 D-alanyl-D-alanine carboxypeptidase [Parasphingorhabdus cellanae]
MNKILLASLPLIAISSAVMAAPKYETDAPIAYMTDLSSGAILFEKDADKPIPPASMAKMMTVYVAFDQIEKGKLKLDQKVDIQRATWQKWQGQGSTMFLGVNDNPTVKDLLHGVITLSGNDASVVLAEVIGGTEENFADMMTKTAKRIGMKNSRFGNSTGWPDEGKTMVTARDLGTLGARLPDDFPKLYKDFFGLTEFTWGKTNSGAPITQPNRNPLLGKIPGADGLKTGHTEEAGFGFTGSAEQKGRRIVSVLAGLDSYSGRSNESVKFMNWGFNAWEPKALFKEGAKVQSAEVQLGDSSLVDLVAPKDLFATVPKGSDGKLSMKVRYNGPIKAPIQKGQQIATLIVSTGESGTQSMPLVAAEAIDEAGFFGRVWAGLKSLLGMG